MLQRTEIRATGHVVNDTKDLVVRIVGKGADQAKVLNFSLAVNNYSSKGASESKPTASFYRISAWNDDAERLARYLHKGKPLTIVGTLELKPYPSRKHDGAMLVSAEVRMHPNGFDFIDGRRRTSHPSASGVGADSSSPVNQIGGAGKQQPSGKGRRSASSETSSAGATPALHTD